MFFSNINIRSILGFGPNEFNIFMPRSSRKYLIKINLLIIIYKDPALNLAGLPYPCFIYDNFNNLDRIDAKYASTLSEIINDATGD